MELLAQWVLVAMMFNPNYTIAVHETVGVFKSGEDCQKAYEILYNQPPVGLAPMMGLACIRTETQVRPAKRS